MTNNRDILRPYEVGIRVYSKVNIKYFNTLVYAYITKKPYFDSKHLKISIDYVEKSRVKTLVNLTMWKMEWRAATHKLFTTYPACVSINYRLSAKWTAVFVLFDIRIKIIHGIHNMLSNYST
jgi:hypothetical protein